MRLRPWWHVVTVAVLFVCAFSARAAESISGQVVHAITGNPLKRVTLTATRVDGKGEPATTQVDEKGQFVFENLAPGGYLLSGERNNFERQIHGSRSNLSTGTVLAVRDGQPVTGVVFRMFPSAAISGRVLDLEGEPLPNVAVRLLRREYRGGKRDWQPAGYGSTNDRGEYRVSGLRAGSYLVNASAFNAGLAMLGTTKGPLPDAPDRINGASYYPGTTEPERAEPVVLSRGEDRRGIDVQLLKTTAVRIRGRVEGGESGVMTVVSLAPRNAAPALATSASGGVVLPPSERSFEVKGVTPGSYWLFAQSMGGTPSASVPLAIEVSDRHMDGVRLQLNEGVEITGRVILDGGAKGTTVHLNSADAALTRPYTATSNEAGEFKFKGVFPVPFRMRLTGLPPSTYLKSVKLNGQAANPENLTFAPGAKIEVFLAKTSAALKGMVLDANEKPFAGAAVVLIPETGNDAMYRTATSDHDGKFLIDSIAPGRYKVLAWEDVEPDAWRDPDVVKPMEERAAPVVFEETSSKEVTLKVIPIAKD